MAEWHNSRMAEWQKYSFGCVFVRRASLGRAMWRLFGTSFLTAGVWKLVSDVLGFGTPLILRQIITLLQVGWEGMGMGMGMGMMIVSYRARGTM